MIDLYPTKCNLCGGKVLYVSNASIYGRQYGSGYCYCCTQCRAYVGTHKPRPKEALGILSSAEMRQRKIMCHSVFDLMWNDKKSRCMAYKKLAEQMGIPVSSCHFGHFDLKQLDEAYEIIKKWEQEENHD
ncbi:MAG: zinc-finger-containing protein [Clostridium sp.]